MSVVDGLERVKGGSCMLMVQETKKGKQRTIVVRRGQSDGEVCKKELEGLEGRGKSVRCRD